MLSCFHVDVPGGSDSDKRASSVGWERALRAPSPVHTRATRLLSTPVLAYARVPYSFTSVFCTRPRTPGLFAGTLWRWWAAPKAPQNTKEITHMAFVKLINIALIMHVQTYSTISLQWYISSPRKCERRVRVKKSVLSIRHKSRSVSPPLSSQGSKTSSLNVPISLQWNVITYSLKCLMNIKANINIHPLTYASVLILAIR